MMNYTELITAKLNIDYDRDLFAKEYDTYLLPVAKPVYNSTYLISSTKDTNKQWNMVDPDIYSKADSRAAGVVIKGEYPTWLGMSLLYLDTDDVELRENSKTGSVAVRNLVLDNCGEFKYFEKYKNLEITKFIKNLPLTTIIGIRCISLDNSFALIHRDNSNFLSRSKIRLDYQPLENNHLWNSGFVQITINISDGNAPLYYCLTDNLSDRYKTINDPIYLFNDYFYHGVSMTSKGLRRQIRITGRPTPELEELISKETIVNREI